MSTALNNILHLQKVAQSADDAWHAELTKEFGDDAGDARYTNKGKSTPKLKELHDNFSSVTAMLQRAWINQREDPTGD